MPPSPIQDTIVGDPLIIDCIATTPVAVDVIFLSFSWTGPGGNSITSNSRMNIIPTTSMDNMYTSSLQFVGLIEADGGNYICNVEFFGVIGSNSVELEPPDCECFIVMCKELS